MWYINVLFLCILIRFCVCLASFLPSLRVCITSPLWQRSARFQSVWSAVFFSLVLVYVYTVVVVVVAVVVVLGGGGVEDDCGCGDGLSGGDGSGGSSQWW